MGGAFAADNSMELITFKALQQKDHELLKSWFDKPHIKKWWYLTNEELKQEYNSDTIEEVFPFIVEIKNRRVAFIQYYYANKAGEGWWPDETENGTVGIDLFIAEENNLNQGWGSMILREFICKIFDNPLHTKIILDVNPKNYQAIRCYEKVGFKWVKKLMTPDGLANMMELKRP